MIIDNTSRRPHRDPIRPKDTNDNEQPISKTHEPVHVKRMDPEEIKRRLGKKKTLAFKTARNVSKNIKKEDLRHE